MSVQENVNCSAGHLAHHHKVSLNFETANHSRGHEELWNLDYANHSYFRIRHLDTGEVVTNISSSISFGFGSAMVDHTTGTAWVFGTPIDRSGGVKKNCSTCPPEDERHGVWAWSSTDLINWTRFHTDVQWSVVDQHQLYFGWTPHAHCCPSPPIIHPDSFNHGLFFLPFL